MGRTSEGILLNDKMMKVLVSIIIPQTVLVVIWSATLCFYKLVSVMCWSVGWIPETMSGVRG